MAIFARRDIQAALNRVANGLTGTQIKKIVDRLNRTTAESLAAEWEVVVLSALRACGRIAHEQNLGGTTRPDILFQLGESGSLEFLTDVRTVSDKDKHERNPYDDFCEAIRRFLRKHGHTMGGFHIDVEHTTEGEYDNQKVLLTLPSKQDMDKFVEDELGRPLSGIARNPNKDDALHYDKDGIRFSIRYDASEKRFSGGSHISYTVPYSVWNPLTNALISKGKQLARSGYQGTKGIIICDGGCDALSQRSRASGGYGCQEIVERYLRGNAHILWVLVLRIEETHRTFPPEAAIAITPRFIWNPEGDKQLFCGTTAVLERMVRHLPQPEATPINAVYRLNGRNGKAGRPFGGYSMQGKTIKISARALTELLAGRVELQKFLETHGFKPDPLNPKVVSSSFFDHQISDGNTLKNAYVEKNHHKDDDWLVLEYDGPDPAISPFHIPH